MRTGCTGNVEQYRVIPTPSSPYGLDPDTEISLSQELFRNMETTPQDFSESGILVSDKISSIIRVLTDTIRSGDLRTRTPNAPMCEMDSDGQSLKHRSGPVYCFGWQIERLYNNHFVWRISPSKSQIMP